MWQHSADDERVITASRAPDNLFRLNQNIAPSRGGRSGPR
jgi:hypothetical protein